MRQDQKAVKRFQKINFKDKIVEKMNSEAKAASTSSTPPNEQDVQFLSDCCDDLVKSGEGVIEGLLKKN